MGELAGKYDTTTLGELAGTRAGGESALYSTVGGVGGAGVPGSGTTGLLGVTNIFSYSVRWRFKTGVRGSSACERGVGIISDSINDAAVGGGDA